MKILLRRNVRKLGQIGEVVDVKPGYARNYLLPFGLAVAPTAGNLKAIEAEKQAYLQELAQKKAELQTQANLLAGKEFTIVARCNEEGNLYGSIGPAQVAQAMDKEGIAMSADNIVLDEPIRKVDKFEIKVAFDDDISATIVVWVKPTPEDLAVMEAVKADRAKAAQAEAPSAPAAETASPGKAE
jgi:large subunit ribosomal protein L9